MSIVRTLNEIRRHMVFKLTGRAGVSLIPKKRENLSHLDAPTPQNRFEAIYADGVWQNGRTDVPGSGPGSSLDATENLRARLPSLLDELGAETLLDIGCGDFTWMKETGLKQRYIGADIVASVIDANQAFANANRSFHRLNAIEDDLPDADTVLCREVLFHLSLADGRRALANILSRPRTWFIATTDGTSKFNADIHTGDYRPLNLRCAPFHFPEPDYAIDDSAVAAGRKIGVWRAAALKAAAQ